jgi:hypothetical protein
MRADENSDARPDEIRKPLPDVLQQEIAHRVLVNGEQQKHVLADMQRRGVVVSRATISRICQRVKARATAIPPTVHTDPKTGIEVEQSEDSILQDMGRDLWREYRTADLRDKIQIAKVLPGVALARLKLREPPPPKPGEPGQPQPSEPPPPTELVRFN